MRRFFPLILVLCCAATAVSLFMYALQFAVLDEKARNKVFDEERGALSKALLAEHPQLAALTMQQLTETSWRLYQKEHRAELRRKVEDRTRELKDRYRDEAGQPYMGGIDSYHWLRHLRNLYATGHVGDRVQDGEEYDALAGRPVDASTRRNVHLYLAWPLAWLAQRTGLPLNAVLYMLPVAMFFAVAGCSFVCAKRIGASDLGAFFACFAITLSPFLFTRVLSEWFDTDIYTVFFPLAILTSYLFSIDIRASFKRRLRAALLSGALVALYASTWKGWWFIFDIILLGSGLYLLNLKDVLRNEGGDASDMRAQAGMLGAFFVFSAGFVMLWNGPLVFVDFIMEPIRLSHVLRVTSESVWPNVYLTVEELSPPSISAIVQSVGGLAIFFIGLIGLVFAFLFERGLRHKVFGCGLLCVALWFVIPFQAALQALRFVLLLVVPAGLAFGLAVGKIRDGLEGLVSREGVSPLRRLLGRGVFLVFAALFLFFHTARIFTAAYMILPRMDDIWQRVLVRIHDETPADSVINSWWDFGHWFKTVTGRHVLFDGMTQNSPYAFWTARVLLSDDEEAAVRVLKMLDGADNKGVDLLVKKLGRVDVAVRLAETVLALGPDKARAELGKALRPGDVDAVMPLLFPRSAPPAYFILSQDMLDKVAAITFIGNWDFGKVDMWFRRKKMNVGEFIDYARREHNLTPEQALATNLEVSTLGEKAARSWFSNIQGYRSDLRSSEAWQDLWMFENGLVVDWPKKRAYVLSGYSDMRGVPKSLQYMEGGAFHEEPQPDAKLDFSALIIRKDKEIKGVLLPAELGRSLLIRLYLMKGEGLKRFRLWAEETDPDGNSIYVYEILWPE